MTRWIEEEYHQKDKPLILYAALLDLAYDEVFFASSPKDVSYSVDSLTAPCALQSYVRLLNLPFDSVSFRSKLLKETVDYWTEHDFPLLQKDKDYHFVLYRNNRQRIVHESITEGHWKLLNLIQTGISLEEACDTLENEGGPLYEEARQNLPEWIRTWIEKRWLLLSTEEQHSPTDHS
jgi:hypothetical protein